LTGHKGSVTRNPMKKSPVYGAVWVAVIWTCGLAGSAAAIEVQPAQAQVRLALDRGKEAAAHRQPPEMFYTRFGRGDGLHPGGFLVTKLEGLSVLATHMALRGFEPSAADIAQVTDASTMQVNAVILGDCPSFALNSYMVLDQGGRIVKPATVRVDGQAGRSSAWPTSPKFQAKIVATFRYDDFDPTAQTTISLFPGTGGEVRFAINFSEID
jgi:hypothetical protein